MSREKRTNDQLLTNHQTVADESDIEKPKKKPKKRVDNHDEDLMDVDIAADKENVRPVRPNRGQGGSAVNNAKWGEKVTAPQTRKSRSQNLKETAPENPNAPKKRTRGRPKGSKNKSKKDDAVSGTALESQAQLQRQEHVVPPGTEPPIAYTLIDPRYGFQPPKNKKSSGGSSKALPSGKPLEDDLDALIGDDVSAFVDPLDKASSAKQDEPVLHVIDPSLLSAGVEMVARMPKPASKTSGNVIAHGKHKAVISRADDNEESSSDSQSDDNEMSQGEEPEPPSGNEQSDKEVEQPRRKSPTTNSVLPGVGLEPGFDISEGEEERRAFEFLRAGNLNPSAGHDEDDEDDDEDESGESGDEEAVVTRRNVVASTPTTAATPTVATPAQYRTTVFTDTSMLGPCEDVLDKYRKRNKKKHSRSSRLGEDGDCSVHSSPSAKTPPSPATMAAWTIDSGNASLAERSDVDFTKLKSFPKLWKRVLEKGKIKMRFKLATDKGLPTEEEGKRMAKDSLYDAMREHGEAGGRFEKGYFPLREEGMITVIFEDRSTFRTELKSLIKPLLPQQFKIFPSKNMDPASSAAYTKKRITRLLDVKKPFYMHRDKDRRKVPFGVPVIKSVCDTFFYGPNKLASIYKDEFANGPPPKALTLVCTVFVNCFDEWASGSFVKKFFYAKFYQDTYGNIHDDVLRTIASHKYGLGFSNMLREWALAKVANVQNSEQERRFRMSLDSDDSDGNAGVTDQE